MNLRFIASILICSLTLQATQMKCAPGKCSANKTATQKPTTKTSLSKSVAQTDAHPTVSRSLSPFSDSRISLQNERRIIQHFNVRTVEVKRIKAAPTQINYGYIVVDETKRHSVSPRFGGYIETLYADTRYRNVKRGDPLAKIYSPEVYKAKREYLNALRFDRKHPAPDMVRASKQKLELLGVATEEINAIASARKIDPYTYLRAPVSGIVFAKNVEVGDAFAAGKRLFEIVDLSDVWIEARLYQDQLAAFRHMRHFHVRIDGDEHRYDAFDPFLYPQTSPEKATFIVRLHIPNPTGSLIPGMYATLYSMPRTSDVLVVPRESVIHKGDDTFVFVATPFRGIYEPVKVIAEPFDDKYYRIRQGVKEGERIVASALFLLDADARLDGLYDDNATSEKRP